MPRLMIIWSLKSQCKNVLLGTYSTLTKCMNAKSVEKHHKNDAHWYKSWEFGFKYFELLVLELLILILQFHVETDAKISETMIGFN